MTLVHVLTFGPSQPGGAFPGVDWAPADESAELRKEYRELVKEAKEDDSMIVRFLELDLTADINNEEDVVDEIDDMLAADNGQGLVAVEQYVPETTHPSLIPTAVEG